MQKLSIVLVTLLFSLTFLCTSAQEVHEPNMNKPEWNEPCQPFRIAGNLYYVGTNELACYLIVTPKGNILINTGLAASYEQIVNNIKTLGFKLSSTKILLTTQAHFDHLGAMAAIKQKTKAKFFANAAEKDVLESGGNADYEMGGHGCYFKPIKPDSLLHDGDTISLGGTQIIMLNHPGHTKGSCSYLVTVKDEQKSYKVLIANMPTIITDRKFADIKNYPTIQKDYAHTLQAMKTVAFDLWVASHASQFSLHEKRKPNDAYNPMAFANKQDYLDALTGLLKAFDDKVKEESK